VEEEPTSAFCPESSPPPQNGFSSHHYDPHVPRQACSHCLWEKFLGASSLLPQARARPVARHPCGARAAGGRTTSTGGGTAPHSVTVTETRSPHSDSVTKSGGRGAPAAPPPPPSTASSLSSSSPPPSPLPLCPSLTPRQPQPRPLSQQQLPEALAGRVRVPPRKEIPKRGPPPDSEEEEKSSGRGYRALR